MKYIKRSCYTEMAASWDIICSEKRNTEPESLPATPCAGAAGLNPSATRIFIFITSATQRLIFFFFTTSPTSLLPRCFAAASESQWWAVTYTRPKENTKRKDKHSPLRQAEGHTHLHPLPQPLPLQHRTLSDDQVVVAHILLLRCQTWGETLMVSYCMRKHTANS